MKNRFPFRSAACPIPAGPLEAQERSTFDVARLVHIQGSWNVGGSLLRTVRLKSSSRSTDTPHPATLLRFVLSNTETERRGIEINIHWSIPFHTLQFISTPQHSTGAEDTKAPTQYTQHTTRNCLMTSILRTHASGWPSLAV